MPAPQMSKNKWLLMFAVLAVIYLLPFESTVVPAAPPKGTFKMAIHWNPSADSLDPATTGHDTSAALSLYLFHDALIKPMPEGMYTPCLAESWTVSPEAKVFEFKLRKGVKFHNGDLMTAEDVIFSFWRYKATHAKLIHDKTEKVEAVGPHLVRYHFKEPFPDFLEYLLPGVTSISWVVPKKYVEKVGDAGFKKNPVGCGPCRFGEFQAGVRLVGEAFEGFWRKVPNIKRLEFYPVTEMATRYAMLKKGEVDCTSNMADVFSKMVKEDPNLRLLMPKGSFVWLVHMDSQWDPNSPWFDIRVRKAASLAIDRKSLADIHFPGAVPLGTLALPWVPGLLDRPADPFDPEGARKLLAEAGYPKGFHGGTFYPYDSGFWAVGEMVATYWKAIGITVNTVLLDRATWIANRTGGKMKGATWIDTVQPPTMRGRFAYLFSGGYGNYHDIRSLWDQFNKAVDPQLRQDLITRIQKSIYDKNMYIPITHSSSPGGFGPRIKGNPYKIGPPIWVPCPIEDLELNE